MFAGLAVWRVKVKALNVKEVLVLYFVPIPLEIGVSLLVPYYMAIPIATGLIVPDNRTVTFKGNKKGRLTGWKHFR